MDNLQEDILSFILLQGVRSKDMRNDRLLAEGMKKGRKEGRREEERGLYVDFRPLRLQEESSLAAWILEETGEEARRRFMRQQLVNGRMRKAGRRASGQQTEV